MEQLDLIPNYDDQWITVHEINARNMFLYHLSMYEPRHQVYEVYLKINSANYLSLAEIFLTSDILLCKKYRVHRQDKVSVHMTDEEFLESFLNSKKHALAKKTENLYRYSKNTEDTKLLCEVYLQLKRTAVLMEDFSEQTNIKKLYIKIKKHLLADIDSMLSETMLYYVESNKRPYLSYLEIKNCLPKGIITTAKAIEMAQEINKKCTAHAKAKKRSQ